MDYSDIKYVVCGKSGRSVDAYVAPYIQPIKPGTDLATIRSMAKALKLKSGFEWSVVVRDVDANNKFVPIDMTDEDRELPMLSTELHRYTSMMTRELREGRAPAFKREHIGTRTPALVNVMILSENKEHQMTIPVDVYMAFSEACTRYYGPYGNLPWGIKRAISAHTRQFHIRLCADSEMTYLRCMNAVSSTHRGNIKISPIIDCGDAGTTLNETIKFTTIVNETFREYTMLAGDTDDNIDNNDNNDTANDTINWGQGHRLGSN